MPGTLLSAGHSTHFEPPWEVVLVTELFGEGEGVIWMGENEHRTALVHGRKAGVLLRGTALLRWIEEGSRSGFMRG